MLRGGIGMNYVYVSIDFHGLRQTEEMRVPEFVANCDYTIEALWIYQELQSILESAVQDGIEYEDKHVEQLFDDLYDNHESVDQDLNDRVLQKLQEMGLVKNG